MKLLIKYLLFNIVLSILSTACQKMVAIDPPTNSITTSETFKDSANASSAVIGMYANMVNARASFMNRDMTIIPGESADELSPFASGGDKVYSNTLIASYGVTYDNIWGPAYQFIYQANAIIEGVQNSGGISATAKNQFLGEAKFLRSLYYFYLVNLFGDVPLVITSDYHANANASRTSKSDIYLQIVNDLKEAQFLLSPDYSISGNDRVRANKWTATALLARVYLYSSKWDSAEAQSTAIIDNSGMFALNPSLDSVFLKNALGNNEPILQFQLNTQGASYNATPEGIAFIPDIAPNNLPNYYLNNQLLNAFEYGDRRRMSWVDSTIYGSPAITYYFPYKYKIGQFQLVPSADPTEYIMVFRLAEQYLIRAEARAQQGTDLNGAANDINIIRTRAGLAATAASSRSDLLDAVMHERQIELFAEWGHRWLDLKRTGQIDDVMTIATPLKGQGSVWQSFQQLYPIPFSETQSDPDLKQNPGY